MWVRNIDAVYVVYNICIDTRMLCCNSTAQYCCVHVV